MKPATIRTQVSSGGVIFRKEGSDAEIALVAVKEGKVWSLPKGIVEKGEEPPETAVREVREETGLSGKIVKKIGDISYWYYIKDDNVTDRASTKASATRPGSRKSRTWSASKPGMIVPPSVLARWWSCQPIPGSMVA